MPTTLMVSLFVNYTRSTIPFYFINEIFLLLLLFVTFYLTLNFQYANGVKNDYQNTEEKDIELLEHRGTTQHSFLILFIFRFLLLF
jgi:hypothetical protein